MNPFSTGRPGRIKRNCTLLVIAQASSARLQNSLPLSTVMLSGNPSRSGFTRSNTCATFIPVIERSASSATHSRVNWSTTVRMRNDRPSANLSLTKSILQRWFGRDAAPLGTARRRPSSVVAWCAQSTLPLDTAGRCASHSHASLHAATARSSADNRAHMHARQFAQAMP